MPAYNEEKRIGRTLEEYSHFFDKLAKQKILEYESRKAELEERFFGTLPSLEEITQTRDNDSYSLQEWKRQIMKEKGWKN